MKGGWEQINKQGEGALIQNSRVDTISKNRLVAFCIVEIMYSWLATYLIIIISTSESKLGIKNNLASLRIICQVTFQNQYANEYVILILIIYYSLSYAAP